jgi:ribosomal protein L11 methylase PrmA
MFELSLLCPEERVDVLSDALDALDALSVSVEDADAQTPAEQAQAQAEMRVQVAQAAQAAKMMGKLSANMSRLVDEVLAPKVNWVDVLRHFMQRATLNERSYERPNRRFFSRGIYLPGPTGRSMGPLV